MGLNSPTSAGQAQLLRALAERLRGEYEDFLGEPLPGQLKVLVERLKEWRPTSKQRPKKGRCPPRVRIA
jgi:uncharacterized coiled-coil protein SlyX